MVVWFIMLVGFVVGVVLLALVTSVVCDALHALLHLSLRAPAPLSWPGLMHKSHHRFLDEQLCFHDDRFWPQVFFHQLPEFALRCTMSFVVGVVLGSSAAAISSQIVVFGWLLVESLASRGRDRDHTASRPVPPPAAGFFVDHGYHTLHHAFPEHFFAAHVSVIDVVCGRLLPLRGREVVVVGGSGYCLDLARHVAAAGATVRHVAVDDLDTADLAAAAILVLGHGSDDRGAGAYEAVIARALQTRSSSLPLDVWSIGDAPQWAARATMFNDRIILRRLIRGPMLGAQTTLFFLRRGLRQL